MTAILYILMRNDLESMNPGKAMAQASHAANAFVHHYNGCAQEYNPKSAHDNIETETMKGFNEWEQATPQGFGTVLTLEARMADISPVVSIFKSANYVAGVVHDPTYTIVDGDLVHYIPLDTCAYIFVPNKEKDSFASNWLKKFPLHR